MCLSSRSLYFTAGEVFFCCHFCHNRESYEFREGSPTKSQIMAKSSPLWGPDQSNSMAKAKRKLRFHNLPSDPDDFNNFFNYVTVVQDFTKRELTLSSDVINAFQGIFNRYIGPGKTYPTLVHEAQCIPTRFLHLALLWYPISGSARGSPSSQSTTPSKLSSWSWTSWHGPVTFVPTNGQVARVGKSYNDLASSPDYDVACLIQASGLPQPKLWSWVASISKMAAAKILSLSSPDTHQLPAEFDKSREPPRPPVDIGVLELWVSVLGSAACLSNSSVPGWWTLSTSHPCGFFKFDQDPGTAMSLHSYLGVAVSLHGTVGVVGVVENDDGKTFRRVGMGWIDFFWFFDGFDSLRDILPVPNNGTTCTLRRVLLR